MDLRLHRQDVLDRPENPLRTSRDPRLAHATWRTSSRSATDGQCVEIAQAPTVTGIRDSKNPTEGRLILTTAQWARFLSQVKNGDLLP